MGNRFKLLTVSFASLLCFLVFPDRAVHSASAQELVNKNSEGEAAKLGDQTLKKGKASPDLDLTFPYKVSSPTEISELADQFQTSTHMIMLLNGLNPADIQQAQKMSTTETRLVSISKEPKKQKKLKKAKPKPKRKSTKKEVASTSKSDAKYETSLSGYQEGNTITVKATAYGVAGNEKWGTLTAMGTQCRPGVIAVDPDLIPLGSKVYVSGYDSPNLPKGGFVAVAEDTGGAIQGNRIDIFMDEPKNVISKFGIQKIQIKILEKK